MFPLVGNSCGVEGIKDSKGRETLVVGRRRGGDGREQE